jgi:hypothetical protein
MAVPKRLADPRFWRRHRWPVVFCAVSVALVVSIAGTKVNSDRIQHDAELGAATHFAVCALRADYRHRIADTAQQIRDAVHFYQTHPYGVPGLASRSDLQRHIADLRRQLEAQQATSRTLSVLRCDA